MCAFWIGSWLSCQISCAFLSRKMNSIPARQSSFRNSAMLNQRKEHYIRADNNMLTKIRWFSTQYPTIYHAAVILISLISHKSGQSPWHQLSFCIIKCSADKNKSRHPQYTPVMPGWGYCNRSLTMSVLHQSRAWTLTDNHAWAPLAVSKCYTRLKISPIRQNRRRWRINNSRTDIRFKITLQFSSAVFAMEQPREHASSSLCCIRNSTQLMGVKPDSAALHPS